MVVSGKQYEISSLTNNKVKLINSLYHRKYRRDLNLFVAEGVRICKEALENNWEIKYLLFNKENKDNLAIYDLVNETTSLGAAFLAGISAGLFDDLNGLKKSREIERTFFPEKESNKYLECKKAVKKVLT